ncbi:hypothetical protein K7432_007083 [Basidiobolus ranarum]|uniref:Vaculolar membrane protein-domain-containing protein n=1 Tax=Basidiobolus ranarum TaxID=34480 RepID=A0ABR2W141_9FUNG
MAPAIPSASTPIGSCSLTDSFALVIQGILALISLSTLLIKRHNEYPRRPLLVWFYDTSKQAFAAGFIHFLNLAISYSNRETRREMNPCEWYFSNVLLDTTIGVVTLFVLLKISAVLIHRYKLQSLYSGLYGDPPKVQIWLKQLCLFIFISLINKGIIILLFLIPYVLVLAHLVLSSLRNNPKVQVVIVMLVFPLVMNTFQFWLIDQLLKAKNLFPTTLNSMIKMEFEEDVDKPRPVHIS